MMNNADNRSSEEWAKKLGYKDVLVQVRGPSFIELGLRTTQGHQDTDFCYNSNAFVLFGRTGPEHLNYGPWGQPTPGWDMVGYIDTLEVRIDEALHISSRDIYREVSNEDSCRAQAVRVICEHLLPLPSDNSVLPKGMLFLEGIRMADRHWDQGLVKSLLEKAVAYKGTSRQCCVLAEIDWRFFSETVSNGRHLSVQTAVDPKRLEKYAQALENWGFEPLPGHSNKYRVLWLDEASKNHWMEHYEKSSLVFLGATTLP